MKLFQFTKQKAIMLSSEQLLMANSIIQSCMPFIRYPTPEQKSLAEKIQRAKNAVRRGHYEMCFVSDAERRAMRDFNSEYCFKLTGHIQRMTKAKQPIANELEAYTIATIIQLKFRG